MKLRKKISLFVLISLLFIIIYMFFAGIPLRKELQLSPRWTTDFSTGLSSLSQDVTGVFQLKSDVSATQKTIPFKLGQNFGYFLPDGTITAFQSIPFKATISSSLWCAFSSDTKEFTVYNPTGEKICSVEGYGFPFVQDDRVFLFSPGGSTFSKYSLDGKQEWIYESYVPIVAFNSSEGGCVAGLADGNLLHFSAKATKPSSFYPGGSDYQVILGADISNSGNLVSCISGLNKQRFVLIQIQNNLPKVIYHEYLDGNVTEQCFVGFSNKTDEAAIVFYQNAAGLGIYSSDESKSKNIKLDGKVLTVVEAPEENTLFVLTKVDQKLFKVYMVDNYSELSGSFSFEATNASLFVQDNSLFIGKDTSISRLDLLVK